MNLTDSQLQTIRKAAKEFGKAELARRLGITRQAIYDVLRRGAGFNEQTMEKIETLMQAGAPPVQACESRSQIEQMIASEVHRLTQEQQEKVYRYCIELQVTKQ